MNCKLVVTIESSVDSVPDFEVFRCVVGALVVVISQARLVSDFSVLDGNVVKLFPNFLFSIKLILQFSK